MASDLQIAVYRSEPDHLWAQLNVALMTGVTLTADETAEQAAYQALITHNTAIIANRWVPQLVAAGLHDDLATRTALGAVMLAEENAAIADLQAQIAALPAAGLGYDDYGRLIDQLNAQVALRQARVAVLQVLATLGPTWPY